MWGKDDSVEKMVERFNHFNMYVNMDLIQRAARSLVIAKSEESKKIFRNTLKQFENKIDLLRLKTEKTFIEVPPKEMQTGPIVLGNFMQGGETFHECRLDIDDLCNGSINAGVGKGKTNTFFHLCKEIARYSDAKEKDAKIGMIIPERIKKDFRNLDISAVVLDIKEMRINFFDPPPNVPEDIWLQEICNALMHAWGWMYASRNYFSTMIDKLMRQRGRVPTFEEVYHEIKKDKESYGAKTRRQSEIQEVNLDRIEQTLRSFGSCLSTRKTFQMHEFISERINLVIEADVTPDSFAILLNWLLLYVYMHNKYGNAEKCRGNISNGGTLLVFDEAYVIWDMIRSYSSDRRDLGADFISLAPLYLRDFRSAILAGSQRPLSPDFQASVNLHAIGFSGDYKDSQYYANSLGDPSLLKEIMKLDRGEFLIRNGDKPAALVKIPFVPFKVPNHRITDEELAPEMEEYKQSILDYCREEEPKEDSKKFYYVSDTTKAFLRDIQQFPDSQLKERYDRLQLKDSSQQFALMEILKSGCITLVKDTLHSKKQSKYLCATQNGISWLRSEGYDTTLIESRGMMGPIHELYQTTLLVRLNALGLPGRKEVDIGKKKVDVVSGRLAFEIAVHQDVDYIRVLSAMPDVDRYYFLCSSVILQQSIRSRIPDVMDKGKLEFRIASDFLLALLNPDSDESQSILKCHQTNSLPPNNQDSSPISHDQPKSRRFD